MGNNHAISMNNQLSGNPNDQIRKKLQELMMIKIVLPNGTVHEIKGTTKPVSAVDAAAAGVRQCKIDDPDSATCTWLVCNAKSLRVGRRPCPLRPNARLLPGSLYFVLPPRAFQSRLTWSHFSILVSRAAPAMRPREPAVSPSCHFSEGNFTYSNILRRALRHMCISRQIAPAPAPAPTSSGDLQNDNSSIDDYDSEVLSHFVDHLIRRSNSWRPGLDSVQEEYC